MTTPTPRWTAETEATLHRALHDLDVRINNLTGDHHCNLVTQVALTALADAGVLTAVGGETWQEWAVRVDEPHPKRTEKAGDYLLLPGGEQIARYGPRIWAGWVPVSRTHHIGPWREVTDGPA